MLEHLAQRPLDVLDPTRTEETERQAVRELLDRSRPRGRAPRRRSCASSSAATASACCRATPSSWTPTTVRISGGDEPIRSERIVIAAGTRPARPASVDFDDRTIIDSDGLLKLERRVPRSMTWSAPA